MHSFHHRRARYVLTILLALAVVLAQGLRVHLHAHDDVAGISAMHAHIDGGWAPLDPQGDIAANLDVSLDATLKLIHVLPLLALVAAVLGFKFARSRVGFSAPATARYRFLDPPYFAPPGHAPPR